MAEHAAQLAAVLWEQVREELAITPERQDEARRVTGAYVTGDRLGELRKQAGITQVEQAKAMASDSHGSARSSVATSTR
ncbi:hypothetical protein FHX42_000347 [Saccharopolyspora lacisalsi]|uniref:Uncharacterized protein n=1 Tax=Halosaccharopolyspora lacisalsi TaxID=1000566 RepID=A0A839DW60_9PSEU|nr:hypothetical protein [Halosaccharopolyspora lacisalsi]MBA8823018.1 hypothetical protein [Halosaccharopolyspora lacisalsi]